MLDIPPPPIAKTAPPTKDNFGLLAEWLQDVMAFHPLTVDRPWTFYEQIDAYLGPWGGAGYPIAYGKKYCVLFYSNQSLNRNPAGARWVTRTLLYLQQELASFIIARFRAGTLGALTEAQLRAAAFDSHPKAYTKGGLTMVVLLAPELVTAIASIPGAEFRPSAPTFGSSVKQVIDTTGIVLPQMIGTLLATAAGPAHNQMFSVASARDQQAFFDDQALSLQLGEVRRLVNEGRCDHLDVLARMRQRLLISTFMDVGAERTAADIVSAIEGRMRYVNQRYQHESMRDQSLRDVFQEFDEDACTWRP